ncbi:MAG: hypothetical protein Q9162_003453 [Coniocarpon cinnabarinum]
MCSSCLFWISNSVDLIHLLAAICEALLFGNALMGAILRRSASDAPYSSSYAIEEKSQSDVLMDSTTADPRKHYEGLRFLKQATGIMTPALALAAFCIAKFGDFTVLCDVSLARLVGHVVLDASFLILLPWMALEQGPMTVAVLQNGAANIPMLPQDRLANPAAHPIEQLIVSHEQRFRLSLQNQSMSLHDAAQTYKARYGLPPPPLFDKWYSYAQGNNVHIYDNYDMIHDTMLPFWSLKPSTLRRRVQAIHANEDSFVIWLEIRDGQINRMEGGLPWQRIAISGMIEDFVQYLPDLDIAFNGHDEPRVVVPHEELSTMVVRGRAAQAATNSVPNPSNAFSKPTDDHIISSSEFAIHSSFADYTHQNPYEHVLLSCPPESPVLIADQQSAVDCESPLLQTSSLSLIDNHTAYTDVCNMPSLQGTHAFFDRPNALSITHGLVPIFSESKLSSFQDIVYPSLWHWYGQVFTNNTLDMHVNHKRVYDEQLDMEWDAKRKDLYWRGSTTGGYSKNGGWRRHHRQRAIKYLNGYGNATTLVPDQYTDTDTDAPSSFIDSATSNEAQYWPTQQLPMKDLHPHINATFSGIGQCNTSDCHAQKEFYKITPYANLSDAFQHRYLLDLDGNAFSARFYGLMRSKSVVFKQSLFREWHDDWLQEWVHYVPLSLNVGVAGRGWTIPDAMQRTGRQSEWGEVLRWYLEEDEKAEAKGIWGPGRVMAERKREWSRTVLRREDMQVWMFRLLLEYARVMDERRGEIGLMCNE